MIDPDNLAELEAAKKAAELEETEQGSRKADALDVASNVLVDGVGETLLQVASAAAEGVGTVVSGAADIAGSIVGGIFDGL